MNTGVRLEKNVSVGNILTMLTFLVVGIGWGVRLEKEVENKADVMEIVRLDHEISQAKLRLDQAEEINRIERTNLEEKVEKLHISVEEMKKMLIIVLEKETKK